jgi:predicted metalloprotease
MRWQGNRQSDNVEDRRGMRGPVMVGGGIGTLVIVVILLLLGVNPQALLQNMPQQPGAGGRPVGRSILAAGRRRACPRARTRKQR